MHYAGRFLTADRAIVLTVLVTNFLDAPLPVAMAAGGLVAWFGVAGLFAVTVLALASPTVLTAAAKWRRRRAGDTPAVTAQEPGRRSDRTGTAPASLRTRDPVPSGVTGSLPLGAAWLERPTTSIFYAPVTEPLSEKGRQAASKLIEAGDELTIEVPAEQWLDVAKILRDDAEFRFDVAIDLCGVDYLGYGTDEWDTWDVSSAGFSRGVEGSGPGRFNWADRPRPEHIPNRFAVVLHLLSISHNRRLRVRESLSHSASRHTTRPLRQAKQPAGIGRRRRGKDGHQWQMKDRMSIHSHYR